MESDKNHINSIIRAIELLGLFSKSERELGVSEISRRMGLHKSSAFRIVRTLEHVGWLEQNAETERYKLGVRILDVAGVVLKSYDYRDFISATLRELKNDIGETAVLSVYTNNGGVCIDVVEADNQVSYTSKLGHHTPVYSGATGKILLAYQSEEEVKRVIEKGLEKLTPNTIITEEKLRADLADIRARGYATSFEETDYGVSAVGVPIFDRDGALLYGLSIVGPTERLREKGIDMLIEKAVSTGKALTEKVNALSF